MRKVLQAVSARIAFLLIVTAVGAAGACGKKPAAVPAPPPPPVAETPAPVPPPPPPPPPVAPPVPPTPSEAELFARKSLAELNAERPLGDVFFDYDRADLSADARDMLLRNASWLNRWTSTSILIEGHADERGTSEYNLVLGERRAAAVRDYLVSLGVAASRLRVVSKGEEDPVCFEASESCWRQNRRGHSVITAK